MRAENELILLTSAINKSESEIKRIEDILSEPVDWGYIIGQLIHHRLTGYFMMGLPLATKVVSFCADSPEKAANTHEIITSLTLFILFLREFINCKRVRSEFGG